MASKKPTIQNRTASEIEVLECRAAELAVAVGLTVAVSVESVELVIVIVEREFESDVDTKGVGRITGPGAVEIPPEIVPGVAVIPPVEGHLIT